MVNEARSARELEFAALYSPMAGHRFCRKLLRAMLLRAFRSISERQALSRERAPNHKTTAIIRMPSRSSRAGATMLMSRKLWASSQQLLRLDNIGQNTGIKSSLTRSTGILSCACTRDRRARWFLALWWTILLVSSNTTVRSCLISFTLISLH